MCADPNFWARVSRRGREGTPYTGNDSNLTGRLRGRDKLTAGKETKDGMKLLGTYLDGFFSYYPPCRTREEAMQTDDNRPPLQAGGRTAPILHNRDRDLNAIMCTQSP